MPGILYHLSFAEEVYRNIETVIPLDKTSFMAGNLIPDLAVDKKNSHYRVDASVKGFFVPDLELVKNDLLSVQDPIKFGMFCHLYLDYYFIEEFLIPEFVWDVKNGRVINPRNNKSWHKSTFFSNNGMYGAYTEINHRLLDDEKVFFTTLESLPEVLPFTGVEVYDTRREKTWKTELVEYLADKKDYTGDIFDYERLWKFIQTTTEKLIQLVEVVLLQNSQP